MTIKHKLQINISLLLICAGIISVVFVGRSLMVRQAEDVLFGVSRVEKETILLYSYTKNYVVSPTSENEKVWRDKHSDIQQTLDSSLFSNYQNTDSIQELKRINNTTQSLFNQISSSQKDQKLRERLEGGILLHSKNFVVESSKFEQSIFAETEKIRQQSSVIFFILLELLFAVALTTLLFTTVAVSKPISELIQAVKRIEGGDFSIRAPSGAHDEIGELGRAFNSMTAKLHSRTHALEEVNAKDESLLQVLHNRVAELENARKAMANLFEDFNEEHAALSDAKAKTDAMIEDIGDGVIMIDKDKKIIVINRVAEHLLGVKRDEVIGRKYYEVINSQDAEGNTVIEPKRPISIVLAAGEKFTTSTSLNATYYYVKKDGTRFPVSTTVTPVILNGETVGAVDIFRDITREKEIEKLRIDFLALASHQLRTPLSGTKWLIETIRRGVTGTISKKQQEYLDQIYQVNERMIALVYDMLDVLKIESGQTIIKKENVSSVSIYKEIEKGLAATIKKRGVIIHNKTNKDQDFTIETDREVLEDILRELVSNAVEYSQKGQEVVLDTKEENSSVIFTVTDSGIGIPKDEQVRIFQRFYRASNAKEYRPEGTGLGLYRATLLAEKISAHISIDSDVGRGATFSLRVPKSIS